MDVLTLKIMLEMGFFSFKNKITGFEFFKVKCLISEFSRFNREHERVFEASEKL